MHRQANFKNCQPRHSQFVNYILQFPLKFLTLRIFRTLLTSRTFFTCSLLSDSPSSSCPITLFKCYSTFSIQFILTLLSDSITCSSIQDISVFNSILYQSLPASHSIPFVTIHFSDTFHLFLVNTLLFYTSASVSIHYFLPFQLFSVNSFQVAW